MLDITLSYQVVTGDCRDLIAEIPDAAVTLWVTSPPYAQNKPYEPGLDWEGLYSLISDVASAALPKTAPEGYCFVNFGETTKYPRTMAELYQQAFTSAGWAAHSRRIWLKSFARCTLTGAMCHSTIPAAEWECLWTFRCPPCTKEQVRNRNLSLRGVWQATGDAAYAEHPAPFPPSLAAQAIEVWSDPGDLIVDPFAGVCSTGVAAISLGRRFIGLEQDPHWAQVGTQRLAATNPPLPFDAAPSAPPSAQSDLFSTTDAADDAPDTEETT